MKANRIGTASAWPITSGGRVLWLGTASLANSGDGENFIVADKINA